MARKSRKQSVFGVESTTRELEVASNFIQESTLATAAYVRLSRENSGHETDDSIKTQIQLVQTYIREHPELSLTDTYVDNGVSGTKFDRPEFNRLMKDVKTGRIQCIVVKDLSRFGRDYLETGYYLDQIFPLLNVRFIAVTDQYDSNRPESRTSLMTPIKNMINAMYAKDFSRKIKATVKAQQELGTVRNGMAPYGYQYDEETKRFRIDKEVEPYVRLLFAWHLAGLSRSQIAGRLNMLQAPTPGGHRFGRKNNWYPEVIRYFLANPTYAGCIALGRQEQDMSKGLAWTKKPREEWKLFPNSHEAYITQEDSDRIVARMTETKKQMDEGLKRTKEQRERMPDVFHGKIYCGKCGAKMRFRRGSHHTGCHEATFQFYSCLNRKKNPNCDNNHIFQQNYLKMLIMDQIRLLIQTVCDRDTLIREAEHKYAEKGKKYPTKRKIENVKEKLELVEGKMLRAYTDFAEHTLEEEEYGILKEKLFAERNDLVNELEKLQRKTEETDAAIIQFHTWADKLRSNLNAMPFDEALVNELVSRITIYDIEHIEVEFACQDMYQNGWMDEFLSDTKEDV